ncbi:MAG TPA: hypothetical protein DCM15_02960 [Cryomorphaceae bacterium]|nr:hypothetical protein [Cryomorphaceae bacterium]|tara:strand:+ start:1668 stop:1853 length:186 start_codon:yes stop_codon:yes gene_type:complete
MDLKQYQKLMHDVNNHLTAAALQVEVISLSPAGKHVERFNVINRELKQAGGKLLDFKPVDD